MAQGQLNAGHLGGRFLERTIPQKVNSVPSCETEIAMPTGQKQAPAGGANRRGRTSVAMIGLAISMGAHSLLLPQASDSATAAEPVPGELTATESSAVSVAAASHTAAGSASAKSPTIEHTVQEGQTLQQLARFYGVDAIAVASANGLALETVLHVGQVLKIPTSSLVARVPQSGNASPEYYGLVSGEPPAPPLPASSSSGAADAALKVQQDEAMTRLSQKREGLRASLSQMKTGRQGAVTDTPKVAGTPVLSSSALTQAMPESQATPEPVPPVVQPAAGSDPSPEPALSGKLQTAPAKGAVAATAPANSVSYQVNAGDTLSAIASAYSVSEEQLAAANRISNPNLIRANQVLKIPQRGSTAVASIKPAIEPRLSAIAADVPVIGAPAASSPVPSDTASLIEARLRQARSASEASGNVGPKSDRLAAVFPGSGAIQPRSEDVIVPTTSYNYVENLKAELLRLREKYSASAPQTVVKVAASAEPVRLEKVRTEPVNPEFSPKASNLRASDLSARSAQQSQSQPQSQQGSLPAVKLQPQKVATASLGSQNYSSLTSSMVGQMVSPNLPPLGSAEAYLPGKSGKFAGYIWPAQGMLSSGYGWRWGRMHKGIDIAAPVGTPVVAAAGGKVTYADWNSGGYGNLVEITHPDGSVTLYAHNNRILVREGQEVSQGEQIAEMGSTGYSTGPHSHFEVHSAWTRSCQSYQLPAWKRSFIDSDCSITA